jgi:hypothetical protein
MNRAAAEANTKSRQPAIAEKPHVNPIAKVQK